MQDKIIFSFCRQRFSVAVCSIGSEATFAQNDSSNNDRLKNATRIRTFTPLITSNKKQYSKIGLCGGPEKGRLGNSENAAEVWLLGAGVLGDSLSALGHCMLG